MEEFQNNPDAVSPTFYSDQLTPEQREIAVARYISCLQRGRTYKPGQLRLERRGRPFSSPSYDSLSPKQVEVACRVYIKHLDTCRRNYRENIEARRMYYQNIKNDPERHARYLVYYRQKRRAQRGEQKGGAAPEPPLP